jgi:polar amino acid transport system substrate-binding protein
MANDVSPEVVKALAPSGTLRAALNFGNTVLVQRGENGGEPRGITPALSRELAKRLGVPLKFVPFEQAGLVFDALKADPDAWDVMFLAVDPKRATEISFTAPYVQIDGVYVVRADSPVKSPDELDRDGIRIAAGKDSAYDLFLTRNLKHARLFRGQGLKETVAIFQNDRLDALAGVKQQMVGVVESNPGLRLLPGRFMTIEQAMGMPKGREAGARYLHAFVEEMKASGFVAKALRESGQDESAVAPPAK